MEPKNITSFRVVLDTNCVLSALLFSTGRLVILRSLWRNGIITPVVCKESVNELIRVLAYPKFELDRTDIDTLLGDFLTWTEPFKIGKFVKPLHNLRDSSDEIFIQLAVEAKTDFLVSGDKHVLEMRETFPELNILSPAEFLLKINA